MSYDICPKCSKPTFRCECKKKKSRDGVPVEAKEWTEADWATMHHGIERIKKTIANRHAEKTK